jgi:arylsulfatase A-like enzyme
VLAAMCGGMVSGADTAAAKSQRPNVLFLFSDDQRHDTIHALGNPVIRAPNLDRLAQSGFVFQNNYVMGSMQGAVCLPSRAMLHSGRTLWHADLKLESGPLWGQTLKQAGYVTFGTGKWHNGPASFARAFGSGKSVFFGGMSDHFKVPVQDLNTEGKYSERRTGEKFSSELFADAAIEFLRKHDGAKPFFLYVAFTAPHDPRTPPGEYATMYDPAKVPLPQNFLPQHPFDNGELWVRDEMLAPHPRTPEIVRQHIADYYGMISHLDAQIGRILKTLEETGRARDTLILFSSDNGLALGRHGLMGKQNVYEHSERMPLIFVGPGIPPGKSDALVYLLDLFPTVCELTGVPAPEGVEGRSLAPVMRGQKQQVRDFILGAYREVQRTIREPRWKLIKYHVGGVKTVQLFDLASDPWELKNLADDPAAAEHRRRLEGLLEKARTEADDPVDFEGVGGKSSGPPPQQKGQEKKNAKQSLGAGL